MSNLTAESAGERNACLKRKHYSTRAELCDLSVQIDPEIDDDIGAVVVERGVVSIETPRGDWSFGG